MARSSAQINKQITDYLQVTYGQTGQIFFYYFNDHNGNPITPSQVSFIGVVISIVSWSQNIFEQLQDVYKAQLESEIAIAPPAIPGWIQEKVFEFQYGDVVQLINFIAQYPVIDISKRIISQCSVLTDSNKNVQIKVATGSPPSALTGAEQIALNAYLQNIIPAGVQTQIISLTSDKIAIIASVYYNGQYADTIQATVIAALNTFLTTIPFDGIVKISAIEDAIQEVPGITDVVISQVNARPDSIPYSGSTVVSKEWSTFAGYIIQETTAGHTFADTLTFIVDNN